MTELVHQSLGSLCLLHDALLVVLPNGPRQLVVVHRRTILPATPQASHNHRVLDLEDALCPVQPPNSGSVGLWSGQQLLEELPQMNVITSVTLLARGQCFGFFHLLLICNANNDTVEVIFRYSRGAIHKSILSGIMRFKWLR